MIERMGSQFYDKAGRSVLFRGVNLPAKIPATLPTFYEGKDLSYVGRPWPLDVAEEHVRNLKMLGMNWVRVSVPWEAVMHEGPGQFDEEYLSYFKNLIDLFEKSDIFVDIDPHQDVFSRFSGGSGAPRWVFELAGLIPENFYQTLAASTEYEYALNNKTPFPYLYWQTNLSKLAAMTMFTLFWAGDAYAPKLPIQHFLQDQYLAFVKSLAERVKHNKNILAIATMNELSKGYIGNAKLDKVSGDVKLGFMPTPLQGFALADGKAVNITKYGVGMLGLPIGHEIINQNKVRAWKGKCIWKEHGVWDYDANGNPTILEPNYFQLLRKEEFTDRFYKPFANRLYKEIRSACDKKNLIALKTSNPQIEISSNSQLSLF